MGEFAAVFIGGGLGSVLRFAISRWYGTASADFPWATLTANVLAAFVLGFAWEYFAMRTGMVNSYRTLVLTGFCGGLSTFSTFSLETLRLYQQQHYLTAAVYVLLSIVASVGTIWLATRLVRGSGWF